jgi:hypothetical protein
LSDATGAVGTLLPFDHFQNSIAHLPKAAIHAQCSVLAMRRTATLEEVCMDDIQTDLERGAWYEQDRPHNLV